MSRGPVVIIGGGHNGLATAALLAKGGVKSTVLERRPVLGGAAATEEFHPGYKVSTCAHVLGPLRPALIEALDLGNRGLTFIEPEPRVYAPSLDGPGIALWGDAGRTAFEMRTSAPADADRYPDFHRSLGAISSLLGRLLSMTPPDIDRRVSAELLPMAGLAMGFRGPGQGGRVPAAALGADGGGRLRVRVVHDGPDAGDRLRAGHLRDPGRPVVGGNDRQPAVPGRGVGRQRRGLGGAGGGRPGRGQRCARGHRARGGGRDPRRGRGRGDPRA